MSVNKCTIAHLSDLRLRDVILGTSKLARRQSRLIGGALRDALNIDSSTFCVGRFILSHQSGG